MIAPDASPVTSRVADGFHIAIRIGVRPCLGSEADTQELDGALMIPLPPTWPRVVEMPHTAM